MIPSLGCMKGDRTQNILKEGMNMEVEFDEEEWGEEEEDREDYYW